jgi:hypothetical protein
MTEVALVATSGGLISEALVQDLRLEKVAGDGRFLADVVSFRSLDGNAPTKTQHDTDLEAAFRTGQALWSAYADELQAGMEIGRLRERLLLPLLELLGFKPVFQRAHLAAGDSTWAITHLGWDSPDATPLLLIADPDLDRPAPGRKRSAHDELQGFLNASSQRWGLLTNGQVLRLLRDFHHTRTRAHVQFDLAAIFEAGAFADFRGLYRLCHVSRFLPAEGPEPPPTEPTDEETDEGEEGPERGPELAASIPLERLYELSMSAGVAAGKRLQPQVRRAIEELANGVLEANPEVRQRMLAEAIFGRELYRELLTVLYRVLFLLFAEQRGMLRSAQRPLRRHLRAYPRAPADRAGRGRRPPVRPVGRAEGHLCGLLRPGSGRRAWRLPLQWAAVRSSAHLRPRCRPLRQPAGADRHRRAHHYRGEWQGQPPRRLPQPRCGRARHGVRIAPRLHPENRRTA